jgi:hypothetical protein
MSTSKKLFGILTIITILLTACTVQKKNGVSIDTSKSDVLAIINKVNGYWQTNHPPTQRAFWDVAAYHTGNMEAYAITKNEDYRKYSEAWAEHNEWKGAKSNNKAEWKYTYGEKDDYVLFGDWQICFQTYIDLYNLERDEKKRARPAMITGGGQMGYIWLCPLWLNCTRLLVTQYTWTSCMNILVMPTALCTIVRQSCTIEMLNMYTQSTKV